MRTNTKPRVYTAQLPSTPVTPQMREQVVEAAKERGMSISDMTRTALSLFLQQNYSLAIEKVSENSVNTGRADGQQIS